MVHVEARVELLATTGLPKDSIVNTFHFDVFDKVVAPPLIHTAVDNFFDATGEAPSGQSVSTCLGRGLTGVTSFKLYDQSDPQPRIPFYSVTGAINVTGGATLPSQLALCASYRAAPAAGAHPRRRRGRLYLGSFNLNASAGNTTAEQRPSANLMNSVVGAMKALKTASAAAASWTWCGYSATDDFLWDVAAGHVDNRFDVIRSRAPAATARTSWP